MSKMQLGAFSISLAVKDISRSKTFYEKLGFSQFAGDLEHKYLIMKNGEHIIGLFQGMFEDNILTFNPGWDHACNQLDDFTDVRDIKKTCETAGLEILQDTRTDTDSGPASFVVVDPDGNPILIDQHV